MRVIRNIIEIILLFILYDFLTISNSINLIKSNNSSMYEEVYNSVISYESDIYTLVFDYDHICDVIDSKYNEYDYKVIKISERSFELKISVNSAFFHKEFNEKFYIKEGELYEKFN